MDKKKIFWGIVIVLIIVVVYFLLRKKKVNDAVEESSINAAAFPLKMGSSGPEVAQLQKYILSQYDSNALPLFGADGKWADETQAAVSKYLKRDSVSLDYYVKAKLDKIA